MATRQREIILLSGEFTRILKKRYLYKVTLQKDSLIYCPIESTDVTKDSTIVQTSDIIGCRSEKSGNGEDHCSTWITVISYPFRNKVFSNKRSRYRVTVTFEIKTSDNFEENSKLAEQWVNVVNCLSRDIPVRLEDVSTCVPPTRGKLLILVNPRSGSGKALTIFKQEVLPLLTDADLPYKMMVTDHAGHGKELMTDLVLEEWYGVVIVSGDGLIYEVINGLMSREDWKSAIKLPIGCLPGGSGNALCCSINYSAGEPVLNDIVLHSTFILIKHRVIAMDLVLLQSPSQTYYSFLSVTWGLMADIDYESEKYRSLGEARFAFGALKRIIGLRTYKGRLSFLPVAEYIPKTNSSQDLNKSNKLLTKIRRFSLRSRSSSQSLVGSQDELQSSNINGHKLTNGAAITPEEDTPNINNIAVHLDNKQNQNIETEMNDNIYVVKDENIESTIMGDGPEIERNILTHENLGSMEAAVLNMSPAVAKETEIITAAAENGDLEIEQEVIVATTYKGMPVPDPLLNPLDQPVPEGWITIEDKFVTVAALYQTHLGSDMLAAPNAHMNDGSIHMLFVREGISRNALLSMFLSFGEGKHVDSPYIEMVRCLAFRLEPQSPGGNIMIDGEHCDPCPIQGQILPGVSKVMAIK